MEMPPRRSTFPPKGDAATYRWETERSSPAFLNAVTLIPMSRRWATSGATLHLFLAAGIVVFRCPFRPIVGESVRLARACGDLRCCCVKPPGAAGGLPPPPGFAGRGWG